MAGFLTNIFFWIFIASLVGGYFTLAAGNRYRDEAALADYSEGPEKLVLRARVFYGLFTAFLLALIASLAILVFQVLQVARPGAVIPDPPPANTATAEPTRVPSTPTRVSNTATPRPTAMPSPTSSATPISAQPAVIGNTNFRGLNFRETPGLNGAILSKLINGTEVLVLGEEAVEADGFVWRKIELEDGTQGWVAEQYLIFREAP